MQTDGTLLVPDVPTVPYITGDGVGAEVTPAMQAVVDAAIQKAYGGKRRIEWKEVLAGERAFNATGSWLPDETMETFQEYLVGIKGPLTTPVGGGIRSLNVAPVSYTHLDVYKRQILECLALKITGLNKEIMT